MARVIFWDVDTQYDFMHADGKLYVPEAERIITNLQRLTNYAHGHGIRIVASADDHVMGHPEISDSPDWQSTFPAHCMRGTAGQKKIPETALGDPLVIEPARTDAKALADRIRAHQGDVLFHKDVSEQLLKDWGDEGVRLVKTKEVVEEGLVEDLARASA